MSKHILKKSMMYKLLLQTGLLPGRFFRTGSVGGTYYNCTVSITDDEDYTVCNAEVYGKRADKEIELYVKTNPIMEIHER